MGIRKSLIKAKLSVIILGLCGILCYVYVQFTSTGMEMESRRKHSRKHEIPDFNLNRKLKTDANLFISQIHIGQNKQISGRRQIHDVSCKRIIEGDLKEITLAKTEMKHSSYKIPSDLTVKAATQNCDQFRKVYGYEDLPNSNDERDFPIAFNILLYKDVVQAEMLIRAIYRPQNYYCLHVDGFSGKDVHLAASALANCFDNVFIASKTENIVYESFARLQADINCMSDHLDIGEDWKYVVNLPSQEFPLKTNAEMVKILRIYNNSNDIEGILGTRRLQHRYIYKYKNVYTKSGKYKIEKLNKKNPSPPHNISIVKGSAYGLFSRQFVQYVINDKIAKDWLNWCRSILSPDEYYWATLNHNQHLQVPGGFIGAADKKPWLAAFVIWSGESLCHGKWQRGVCVFGLEDLNKLVNRKELFANKFLMDFDPFALQCLSEWLYNKTVSPLPFDNYYYKQLPFIKQHF